MSPGHEFLLFDLDGTISDPLEGIGRSLLREYFRFVSGGDIGIASVKELCRTCREVRIFPLLQLGGENSPYIEPVCTDLRERGYAVEIVDVPYEFQRGGNKMLRVSS